MADHEMIGSGVQSDAIGQVDKCGGDRGGRSVTNYRALQNHTTKERILRMKTNSISTARRIAFPLLLLTAGLVLVQPFVGQGGT
jgi:hypothetical protein